MIAEGASKKRIALSTHIDPAVSRLSADQRRLKQILVNLLSNAVKFTPAGGQVGFEVQGDQVVQEVSFTVWDTGIGIAPEDQRRLFQPFVQIDSSLSRQYAGTGLGLSLVDRLARMHGGRVELVSVPGQGSRFTVVIPWRIEVPASAASPAPEPARLAEGVIASHALIMIVDDNNENIDLLREYLEALDYVVAAARSGVEALGLISLVGPDLVVMDIQMPGVDGVEVIRQIRTDATTVRLPIIALTALAMVGDRERCLEAGASAYVSKPFSLRELAALIASLIDQAR
jgi:CheY-like chemotaxis protein/anti-sigma regulatory factor (Ser/Thr protein kinase)